jgi:hypothetical protein
MNNPTYEPISLEDNTPATKADIERILQAIEYLAEQINNR